MWDSQSNNKLLLLYFYRCWFWKGNHNAIAFYHCSFWGNCIQFKKCSNAKEVQKLMMVIRLIHNNDDNGWCSENPKLTTKKLTTYKWDWSVISKQVFLNHFKILVFKVSFHKSDIMLLSTTRRSYYEQEAYNQCLSPISLCKTRCWCQSSLYCIVEIWNITWRIHFTLFGNQSTCSIVS